MKNYEYFNNKRDDKVYVSPCISGKYSMMDESGEIHELTRPLRIISAIVPCTEGHSFIKHGQQTALRITAGEKQEIIAKIYEDTREITTLTIQKYSKETGVPRKTYFTFIGEEIHRLVNFIINTPFLPISKESKQQFTDDYLKTHVINKEQALRLLENYPELLADIIESEITNHDIALLASRKKSLEEFWTKLESNDTSEAEWQVFFETNTWIFGYGLNYVFNSPLKGEKLEQVVSGHNFNESGKRVDALLARRGLINTLCMVEIKKHTTPLLRKEYRGECFPASSELSGGIAQIQKTVHKSLHNIKIELKDSEHNPTGEIVFNYQPKSYLVIGSLNEFVTDEGINQVKYGSFELLRRNISNPEIITFDELYERAKFIVSNTIPAEKTRGELYANQELEITNTNEDDLPF